MGGREARTYADGFAQLSDGLGAVASLLQDDGEIEARDIVLGGHVDGVPVERDAVAPVLQLLPGEGETRQTERRGRGDLYARPTLEGFGDSPDQGDGEADHGDVGVAIGPRLGADLDQADDRQQRDQVPEPADGQVGRRGKARIDPHRDGS